MNVIAKSLISSTLALATMFAASTTRADDIVETAVKAGKFKTLAAALGAADLVETLQGPGPFTVFAPTDEAFAALPAGTVETLLKPENKATLAAILAYHVVPGKVKAADVVKLTGAVTVNGQRVDIKTKRKSVMVDGAKIVATDIECDNGVIHIIDSVILPADKTIPEVATAAKSFTTLLAAAKAAGLVEALSGKGPLTVFAPTDKAFAKLPEGTVESLLKPENREQLAAILKYHVVAGRVYSDAAVKAKTAKTLQGSSISIEVRDGGAFINDSKLLKTDLDASNGVIHVINAVLMPPAKKVSVHRMLEKAVAQGSTLYNHGDHAGCARVYMQTLESLKQVDEAAAFDSHMSTVLVTARKQHCPTQRAWTLRRGIDRMAMQLLSSN